MAIYSVQLIPKQAFAPGVKHVKPVIGYSVFFSADSVDPHDLEAKVDSDTANTATRIDICCFGNHGYLAFGAESEAEDAMKKLTYLKSITIDEWYDA